LTAIQRCTINYWPAWDAPWLL